MEKIDENMYNLAIEFDRLETLKWLHSKGCPLTMSCCKLVENDDISQWMIANNCPCNGTLHH